MSINQTTITVTPLMARKMLEKNASNRRVSLNTVKLYARDIANGRWLLNGEPIIIDENGNLRSGQHRLLACIDADRPFQTAVVRGISKNAIKTIDTGRKRTSGDVLQINGEQDSNRLAA